MNGNKQCARIGSKCFWQLDIRGLAIMKQTSFCILRPLLLHSQIRHTEFCLRVSIYKPNSCLRFLKCLCGMHTAI